MLKMSVHSAENISSDEEIVKKHKTMKLSNSIRVEDDSSKPAWDEVWEIPLIQQMTDLH